MLSRNLGVTLENAQVATLFSLCYSLIWCDVSCVGVASRERASAHHLYGLGESSRDWHSIALRMRTSI